MASESSGEGEMSNRRILIERAWLVTVDPDHDVIPDAGLGFRRPTRRLDDGKRRN
jgi:hypothetical protein